MKLSECTLGRLVCTKDRDGETQFIGMVMGLTAVAQGEQYPTTELPECAIPLVKFAAEQEARGIHPGNLHPYEE